MRIPKQVPFTPGGDMVRFATAKAPGVIWRPVGPIRATYKLKEWQYARTVPFYVLTDESTGKLVYMFFVDFMATLLAKGFVGNKFKGLWIAHSHGGVYGMRMHHTDPDCPEGYEMCL